MQISITGRHVDLNDGLRRHVERRIEALKRYFDGVISAHVVLGVERARHIAEVTIHANQATLHAEDQTSDLYASIDGAIHRIETQLKKHKDRLHSHRTRSEQRAENLHLNVGVLDAENVGELSAEARVIRSQKFAVKPMTIDEAALQMDLFDHDFLVFLNANTRKLNVIYRRRDNAYGLIEPIVEEES